MIRMLESSISCRMRSVSIRRGNEGKRVPRGVKEVYLSSLESIEQSGFAHVGTSLKARNITRLVFLLQIERQSGI